MLHVNLLILKSVALASHYLEGETYVVREDIAAELVRMGAATPLAVDEQRCDDGHVSTLLEREACLELMHSLVPAPPPAVEAKE